MKNLMTDTLISFAEAFEKTIRDYHPWFYNNLQGYKLKIFYAGSFIYSSIVKF